MAIERETGAPAPERSIGHKKKVGQGKVKVVKTQKIDDVESVRPGSQSYGSWQDAGTDKYGHLRKEWREAGVPGNATHASAAQNYNVSGDLDYLAGEMGDALSASASEGRARRKRRVKS